MIKIILYLLLVLPATLTFANPLPRSQFAIFSFNLMRSLAPLVMNVYIAEGPLAPRLKEGIAFVAQRNGILITDAQILTPLQTANSRLKIYVEIGSSAIEAQYVGIDLPQDLAVLRMAHPLVTEVSLLHEVPKKGTPAFLMSRPTNSQPQILNSPFKEMHTLGPYERMEFISEVKPFQGLVVNLQGKLIAFRGSSTSGSGALATSSVAIQALLDRSLSTPTITPLAEEVHHQLENTSEALTRDWLLRSAKSGMFAGWSAIPPSDGMNCSLGSIKDEQIQDVLMISPQKYSVQTKSMSCKMPFSIRSDSGLKGSYDLSYFHLDNPALSPFHFFQSLANWYRRIPTLVLDEFFMGERPRPLSSRRTCNSQLVMSEQRIALKVDYCIESEPTGAFFNGAFKAVTAEPLNNALMGTLLLRGFLRQDIQQFARHWLNHIGKS